MKNKKILVACIAVVFALTFSVSGARVEAARTNVTDWYIQNFDSEITVNRDSSLNITEKITADCGNAAGKHGIFRVLPEQTKLTDGTTIQTPVELIGIVDFQGRPHKYSETRNQGDKTVTWKIGDPDKTVQGVNYYLIRYRVKNAIRFANPQLDELYWNLSGNFWDLEIDQFHAKIIFPPEVAQNKSTVDYYTGSLGDKGQYLAAYRWSAPNVLEFTSTGTFGRRQGLTVAVTFPKNIFAPHTPTFWEKYGPMIPLLIPLAVFFSCFCLWWKYGKDPRVDKTVIAEYDAPGNLSPIELGVLKENGTLSDELITAEIVNLAVTGLIKINETDSKMLFFHSKNYELERIQNLKAEAALNPAQRLILEKIFGNESRVKLSSLKDYFYKSLKEIKTETENLLSAKKLILIAGLRLKTTFIVIGSILLVAAYMMAELMTFLMPSLLVSGLIVLAFGYFMPKRTPEGAELNWQIKGFKLFMETVDKHRAEFYEKENIFEKFLPYAIVFGITKIWIKKMQEIYGADYYANYAPAWYVGNATAFDANSFSTVISNLSSDIASNTSAPSGSGGGGGAGGGGGGGGGGGW